VPAAFEMVGQSAGTLGDRLAHGFQVLEPGVVVALTMLPSARDHDDFDDLVAVRRGGRRAPGRPGATSGALADPSTR